MNEDDTEQIVLYMEQGGYLPVGDPSEADVVLLNTCSVRRKPEDKVYSKLGELAELKRDRPDMVIGACGCMAQVEAREIVRRAPCVDFVVGPGYASEIPRLVAEARAFVAGRGASRRTVLLVELEAASRQAAFLPMRASARPQRLRAYVPVMYGCDRFCTFCIVPSTRGPERSRPVSDVINEIRVLAASGTREVTLLGQTVNSYGRRLPDGVTFEHLLGRVSEVVGIERIRFTSPHPRGFTDGLIEAMASLPKVCEHVHLPLQAAEDGLLRRMKRGYSVARYGELLARLREAIPGLAVTTDIMLGFPGETESQFEATMEFVRQARFDAAFMFAYSPRRGTLAADMPDQVPRAEKVRRLTALIELQNTISAKVNAALTGSVQQVLVDGPSARDRTRWTGLTRTFKTTHIEAADDTALGMELQAGSFVDVRITEGRLTGLMGRLADPQSSHQRRE